MIEFVADLTLVIDDDPINNLICEKVITHAGAFKQVRSFISAHEALGWLKTQTPVAWPELILLDINMPLLDGWDFLEQLRPYLPENSPAIYILSSSVSEDDQEKALAHDLVTDFVSKPLTVDKLRACSEKAPVTKQKTAIKC